MFNIPPIHRNGIRIALIVGTLLASINYGDKILADAMVQRDWIKLFMTYIVPYVVSVYSATKALKATQANT